MDELIKNLPPSELKFIEDNKEQADYYYNRVRQIKQNNRQEIIRCKNRKERKFVHIFSFLLNLNHGIYQAREPNWSLSDPLCGCIYCRKEAGDFKKIHGVIVSIEPLKLNRIDIKHQKYFYNMYKLNEINKRIENGDNNIPNWMVRKNFKQKKKENIENDIIY